MCQANVHVNDDEFLATVTTADPSYLLILGHGHFIGLKC
jgi:hypothetical protein